MTDITTDSGSSTWITPFKKQGFVALGVVLNVGACGMVNGYTAFLLPQLRQPDTSIQIDDSSGSWIVSIVGIALVVGNFIILVVMANFGRKIGNIASILPLLVGWISIFIAKNIPTLLVARFLQGLSMGMAGTVGPVLLGEYSSPKNRGAFLSSISIVISSGILTIHTMGIYLPWKISALLCTILTFADLVIVIFSPESPSFLATQGKYDECQKVFRWLRGDKEEEELQRMIESAILVREAKKDANIGDTLGKRMKGYCAYFNATIRKRAFYIPIFIMIHIYTLSIWAGGIIVAAYAVDIFDNVVGSKVDMNLMIMALDLQRCISNAGALYFIKKVKRRKVLKITVGLNITSYLSIAVFTYMKGRKMLPFSHPAIGVLLIHAHMFSIATGTLPLPFIIAGEIFPLEYRGLAGGISVLFQSANIFLSMKTLPYLFKTFGIYGAYFLYASIVSYCFIIALIFLPETKDRTLQDIEDDFRGRPLTSEEFQRKSANMVIGERQRERHLSIIT